MVAYPWSLQGRAAAAPPQRTWRRLLEYHLPNVAIVLMIITLAAAVLYPHVVVTVPSGHVGVLWKRLRGGTVLDPNQLRAEGLRIILPWDELFLYDLRLQSTTDTYNAISKDGVSLTAAINVRFSLKRPFVPKLHQTVGPNYTQMLVRPEIGNRMREIIAEYTAEEVYSTKRQEIQHRIRGHAVQMLGERTMERERTEYEEDYKVRPIDAIDLSDTLILGIELPPAVVAAINRKVEQYYLVDEYAFRVEREKRESERKQIEANGILAFQTTVSQGISDSYLRWRGIEATLALAQSPNSKVVIVGGGKDGLPIILGNVDAPNPAAAAAATPANGKPGATDAASIDAATRTAERTLESLVLPAPAPAPAPATVNPPAKAAGANAPAAAKPDEPRSSAVPTWSEIEALLSRLNQAIRAGGADTASVPKQPAEKPAAAPAAR